MTARLGTGYLPGVGRRDLVFTFLVSWSLEKVSAVYPFYR